MLSVSAFLSPFSSFQKNCSSPEAAVREDKANPMLAIAIKSLFI